MIVLRKFFAYFLILLTGSFLCCNQPENGVSHKQLFDLNWKFDKTGDERWAQNDFDDKLWRSIDLPHEWSADSVLAEFTNLPENKQASIVTGWYRKNFEIPENWAGKQITIDFEGISKNYEMFVNGVAVKQDLNKTTGADLTRYLNPSGRNLIAIKVVVAKDSAKVFKPQTGIFSHVWLIIKESSDLKK